MNTGILRLWGAWDTIYQRCTRLRYIEKGNNIFRIVLLRYRGEPLVTADNRIIQTGDLILKLHIHNYYFATLCQGVTDDLRVVLLLRRHILKSLPQLAAYLSTMEEVDQIKGIVGTTMLHKGVEPLGFSISDVPMSWFFHYKRWYLRLMVRLIHPEGKDRVQRWDQIMPLKRVYMSKEELFRRYLSNELEPAGGTDS
ncbi:YkoP family protein [Brevibacillus sp. H7]|uniref:YkoP family protein n=1 Tax=Brevibacillus sp. H7 TaxID=3349138 RepID=UPI0037F7B097